jgi:hypothetical protein
MAKRFTIEILMNLAKAIGANPSKFMGTRTNITFLGKGPTKNPLFQGPVAGLEGASEAQLGSKDSIIGAVEDAMGFASAQKLNSIQIQALGINLENILKVYKPPVLPMASVTDIRPGILGAEALKRFPKESHKFFGRPLKKADYSEIDRLILEGKIPDARGRTWDFKTPKPGAGELGTFLDTKTGISRAIARQILLQDPRINLTDKAISSLKLSKDLGKGKIGSDPLDMMKLFYKPSSMANYDEFLNATTLSPDMSAKAIAARILREVELLPNVRYAEGGLAEILQVPRRGRVVHPGGYRGEKMSPRRQAYINLSKAGGSRQDYINLANSFNRKYRSPHVFDLNEAMILGMGISRKKGGRVGYSKGRLVKSAIAILNRNKKNAKYMFNASDNVSPGYAHGDIKYNAELLADQLAEDAGVVYADLADLERTKFYGTAYDYLAKEMGQVLLQKRMLRDIGQKMQLSDFSTKGRKPSASGGLAGILEV